MLGWGAAYVPSAWLVESWPPLLAAGARLTLAGLAVLGLLAALGRPLRPGLGPGGVAWLALTQTVLFYAATFWGIAQAGAGLAAVLANTDPLFVAALAALFLDERLGRAQWAGLAIGLVGAGVVVWEGPAWPPALSGSALVVVGGALAWSLGTVAAARGLRGRADPLALAGWQMTLGGLALLGAAALLEGGAALGSRELALVVGLALVGSAAPAALFYLALVRAPAAEVSAWFFLVPVVGVGSAWPLLGEQPGVRLWVGLAAVTGGLWLVLRPAARAAGPLVDSAAPR
jgi:probable blue pigment (indigoidine) exporter